MPSDWLPSSSSRCCPRLWRNQWGKKINIDYDIYFRPTRYTTTIPNGPSNLVKKFEYTYVSSVGANQLIQWIKEWDFGSGAFGALLRQTNISYLSSASYTTINIINRPVSRIIYNGAGTIVAQTQFGYDESPLISTSGSAPGHDYTNYSSTFLARGNMTSKKQWRNTDGVWLTTTYTYDDLGNLRSTRDPNGNITTFSYADNFTDVTNRNAQAYVTQVTLPTTAGISHIQRNQYYWSTGRLAASCGQNFAAASACSNIAAIPQSDYQTFTYDLALNRPLVSAVGDGGQTKNVYNDTSSPLSSTRNQSITASLNLAGTTIFDGTGRTTQTRLTSDPDGADYTDTTYDSLGRVKTVSNPHRTTALSSDGITAYSYDPLGRVTTVTLADGSTSLTSYSGNCVTVTDPSLKARKSCSDALGRLISVSEDPTGLNYLTTYSYDALDNLTSVVQAGSRNRTFTYNSLSQLLTAINPESGTLTYTYDSNGNVKTKVAPLPNQTGTSTVTTGYTYDALNRLTQKSYSDGSLAVYFYYDACSFCTAPITNGIGRLVHTSNNVNAAATYGYDPMGRVKTHSGCLPLSCVDTAFPINVNYDLAGDMTSYSVMGTTFTQTIDAAQRVTQIS
ncbi:MAG: hypothetical protein M3P45_01290, partial [Acidobacteriota bacterium]|nr:hypothetical protein [Acidobacteriota bacterium]